MADEQQAAAQGAAAEAQAQELSLLDQIMQETKMAPGAEGYDVAKKGVSAFIAQLMGDKSAKADKTVVDAMLRSIRSSTTTSSKSLSRLGAG